MKKQIKDRVYILKSSTTRLSFMLSSRNTRRHPLLYFDEEKGINRPLRYARNQKTPFEDEQDDNAILEPVVFEDGFLTVPKNNPVLQWFLSLHPGLGQIFEELDTEKDAAQEVYNMDVELDAEVAARDMSIDVAESIARVIMGSNVSRMSSAEIKRDVRIYSRQNPEEFLQMLDDPMIKLQSLSQKALDENILTLKNKGRDVYFNLKENKKKMITVPFDEKPITAIASYLQTDDGIEVMKMLEKKLK